MVDGEAPPAAVPTEEEPKQITLDEWRAQRAARQKPQYNLRKAGEGEDPNQWKKMYELNKKKEEEEESDEEDFDAAAEYPQRVGRQKHVLDINIHFNDRRVGGGGRGRGGRTGRGGRGGTGGAGRGADRERAPGERPPQRNYRSGQDSDQVSSTINSVILTLKNSIFFWPTHSLSALSARSICLHV